MLIGAAQVSPHITNLFDSTCINVFQNIDQNIKKVNHPFEPSDALTAYINADSSDLNVALLLSIPKQLLTELLPANEAHNAKNENALGESILELSNQLLGKLKSQLVSDQCRLNLGLPELCVKTESSRLLPVTPNKHKLFYQVENNFIECWLAVDVINKNMTMSPANQEINASFKESELELF